MITLHGNGVNPNSIIAGAMQTPGGLYAAPGNMMPIGTVGYNPYAGLNGSGAPIPPYMQNMGGYYNPYAGSYYNPQLEYERRRNEEIHRKEDIRNQSDIMKTLSRNADAALGGRGVNIEEHVKRYDPIYDETLLPGYKEQQEALKIIQVHNTATYVDDSIQINYFNRMLLQAKQNYPDTMTFAEFCKDSGKMGLELAELMEKERAQNLSRSYNSEQYKQLVDLHKGSGDYFRSVFGNGANNAPVTIDDLEVKLPDTYAMAFADKKKAFMEAIFPNKNGG